LDTGSDVSIIAARHWPKRWTCQPLLPICPLKSAQQIHWNDEERHSGVFAPYVLDNLLVNLWGRDVLEGVGVIVCSPNIVVSHQMFQQAYNVFRGLGKYQQGKFHPVQPLENLGRMELGYQAMQHFH
jgi:hypothetical protein